MMLHQYSSRRVLGPTNSPDMNFNQIHLFDVYNVDVMHISGSVLSKHILHIHERKISG